MKWLHFNFLIIFVCLTSFLKADNFSEKITLEFDKIKVKMALKLIAGAADVKIIISDDLAENLGQISYKAENEEAKIVLTKILESRGVKINFKSNNVAEISPSDPNIKP